MKQAFIKLLKSKTKYRKFFLAIADVLLVIVSYLATWVSLSGRLSLSSYFLTMMASLAIFTVCFLLVFKLFGMYESLWRYAEAYEFLRCILATVVAAIVFLGITIIVIRNPYFPYRIPYSVYFLSAFFAGISTLVLRMAYRALRAFTSSSHNKLSKRTLIVGAGDTGNKMLTEILRHPKSPYNVICFVDDDSNKRNRVIHKIKVEGNTRDIPKLVANYDIEVIIIALPNANVNQKRRVSNICAKTNCILKKAPDFYEFVDGKTNILANLQNVSIEDLLNRDPIIIDDIQHKYIVGKTVMVTGGGGSIGSELSRQIASRKPERLVIVDIYENNAYEIQQELVMKYGSTLNLSVEIASVRDSKKMDKLFSKYKPQIVFHTAAHKHVPLMENVPEEAVKNNVYGTYNIAKCAKKYEVEKFVLISTDKAVNPTNIMGTTKRVCEMIVQSMNAVSPKTDFVAVRFGNVLGSNGSVIPLFKKQIESGGPVTVTHPDIIRYFMTIPEAVSLVMAAGNIAHGGEIFILDMGDPVKITDLAENLIRLSGLQPGTDIEIKFTGLRPGEKMHEELLMAEEGIEKTESEKIYIGKPIDISPDKLFKFLDEMKPLVYGNQAEEVVEKLRELVPTYHKEENTEEQEK